ncbi:hypothetical protein CLF_104838 [Clonorchis sinensis]|uniref:Uncharacterized protein n=1 Tax=Clonorchis sinensis TaxID=79923 RepID=G7YP09_CLOSI|nr:hypothetical protein CLF_104838 [Clonorchis sinensis]
MYRTKCGTECQPLVLASQNNFVYADAKQGGLMRNVGLNHPPQMAAAVKLDSHWTVCVSTDVFLFGSLEFGTLSVYLVPTSLLQERNLHQTANNRHTLPWKAAKNKELTPWNSKRVNASERYIESSFVNITIDNDTTVINIGAQRPYSHETSVPIKCGIKNGGPLPLSNCRLASIPERNLHRSANNRHMLPWKAAKNKELTPWNSKRVNASKRYIEVRNHQWVCPTSFASISRNESLIHRRKIFSRSIRLGCDSMLTGETTHITCHAQFLTTCKVNHNFTVSAQLKVQVLSDTISDRNISSEFYTVEVWALNVVTDLAVDNQGWFRSSIICCIPRRRRRSFRTTSSNAESFITPRSTVHWVEKSFFMHALHCIGMVELRLWITVSVLFTCVAIADWCPLVGRSYLFIHPSTIHRANQTLHLSVFGGIGCGRRRSSVAKLIGIMLGGVNVPRMFTQANRRRKKAETISTGQMSDHVRANTFIVVDSTMGYQTSFPFAVGAGESANSHKMNVRLCIRYFSRRTRPVPEVGWFDREWHTKSPFTEKCAAFSSHFRETQADRRSRLHLAEEYKIVSGSCRRAFRGAFHYWLRPIDIIKRRLSTKPPYSAPLPSAGKRLTDKEHNSFVAAKRELQAI